MSLPLIRDATLDDIPTITTIYGDAVRHGTASFEIDVPDEAEMARRFTALVDNGFPYIVAEVDGALAGYAYAGPYRTRYAYRFTVEDSIYVAPQMHRRGVGRALLSVLVKESTRRGYKQMLAVIGDSSNSGSIQLHRAAGFHMIGTFEHVGFKFDRWLDTVLMQRELS